MHLPCLAGGVMAVREPTPQQMVPRERSPGWPKKGSGQEERKCAFLLDLTRAKAGDKCGPVPWATLSMPLIRCRRFKVDKVCVPPASKVSVECPRRGWSS